LEKIVGATLDTVDGGELGQSPGYMLIQKQVGSMCERMVHIWFLFGV